MANLLTSGTLNIPSDFDSFQVDYHDIGNDVIQVDVTGSGLLASALSGELEVDINTNILIALRCYSEMTGHMSTDIGYDLILTPIKRKRHEASITLYIIFKKPVSGASAYSLIPTIKLITASILAEVFIL